jgi:hypothetical protein
MELTLGVVFAALAIVLIVLAVFRIGPMPVKIARYPSIILGSVAVMLLFSYYF